VNDDPLNWSRIPPDAFDSWWVLTLDRAIVDRVTPITESFRWARALRQRVDLDSTVAYLRPITLNNAEFVAHVQFVARTREPLGKIMAAARAESPRVLVRSELQPPIKPEPVASVAPVDPERLRQAAEGENRRLRELVHKLMDAGIEYEPSLRHPKPDKRHAAAQPIRARVSGWDSHGGRVLGPAEEDLLREVMGW
jgi:hypothetical protein